jgi:SAM-dependent methyltransferase
MQPLNTWVYACPKCGFQASTLAAAEGTGILGLEALRRENFEILLDRLEKVCPLKLASILEVGSAGGWFLEAATRRGARIQGIEPEAANAELARTRGFVVETGFFPIDQIDRGPFDVIIFNDVFEHLPKPSMAIQEVQSLLKPGGIAVINCPSSKGMLFRIASLASWLGMSGPLERLWQVGMPSPHVSYFSPENLNLMARRHSHLELIERFSLKSVSRDGLSSRIGTSYSGIKGRLMLVVIWGLSFVMHLLPPDIEVSVFRNPG